MQAGPGCEIQVVHCLGGSQAEISGLEANRHGGDIVNSPVRDKHTILIVDDDDGVRGVVCEILEGAGHFVIPAAHGFEAVNISSHYQGHIDLLITDVDMPRMSGQMVAEVLLKTHPRMQIIFISGRGHTIPGFSGGSALPFLLKPFTKKALINRVEELLVQSASSCK